MKNFELISQPKELYRKMLKDISHARKSIYLETYIYSNDKIGRMFREELIKKAKQGIKVKVLIDSFGSAEVRGDFFSELIQCRGEVKFFRNISYFWRIISQTYEINHRKLLVIDSEIAYFGSANITSKCLNWRELNLRIEGEITAHFAESFNYSWNFSENIKRKKIKAFVHKGFEILHDLPSKTQNLTHNKYAQLINQAESEILIETPYFVPTLRIRRALRNAVKRGVRVKILLPHNSDVFLMDIIRNRYLHSLHKSGIEICYYLPKVLHSKLLMIDNKLFLLGSSNLDFRSFFQDYQLNLFGQDKKVISELRKFFDKGMAHSEPFSYEEWKSRSSFSKMIEIILLAIEERL